MPGHQLFLASSEVLQHVLLPWLSAADVLRLGLTCKALLSWVLSSPPALWQVTQAGPQDRITLHVHCVLMLLCHKSAPPDVVCDPSGRA